MNHHEARDRLPDLLLDRDDRQLLAHVNECHECQAQLFRLARVDRVLRGTRRIRRRHRLPLARTAAAAVATLAAAVTAAAVVHPPRRAPTPVSLRTPSGEVVATASIARGDSENEALALVAHGLPAHPADTYALWTRAPRTGRSVLVGRFMVSHDGECRARFNLPGAHHPHTFWIAPVGSPADVVAST